MNRESNELRIMRWAQQGTMALREIMPLHSPLVDMPAAHRHRRAMIMLSTACLNSTESVLYLVRGLRLWDAERVMRAVVEGTVKFGYLLENENVFLAHAIEYVDVLPEISKLKWHSKAQEAIKALGKNIGNTDLRVYRELLLSNEEIVAIREVYPRDMRRDIERRWGFTALLDEVTAPGGVFGPAGRVFLHGYSMASHLHHMSLEGAELPFERDRRPNERREAIEMAHAAKLVSDCYELTWLRIVTIARFFKLPSDSLCAMKEKHKSFLTELHDEPARWALIEYGGSVGAAA